MHLGKDKRLILVGRDDSAFPRMRELSWARKCGWDAMLSHGPRQVLTHLESDAVDAIVIDGATLGIDRDTFFTAIRNIYPDVALLLVREHAFSPLPSSALGVVSLPPDSDGEVLVAMVDRAYQLNRVLCQPAVHEVVGTLSQLPTLAKSYHALNDVVADPDSNIADIAGIIQSDAVMTVKILQLVNSAFFGRTQRLTSIAQAVGLLGVDRLKSLVSNAHMFETFNVSKAPGFSFEKLQGNSNRVACVARRFLKDQGLAAEAFTAGVILDIGKMILAIRKPDQFGQVIDQAAHLRISQSALERSAFGVGHSEVGAYLLSTWGIPWSVVECVAFHHHPSQVVTHAGGCEVLAAVHAADALVRIMGNGEPEDRLDLDFLDRAGLMGELPRWRKIVEEERA